ncbi:MAG: polysaccharide deacetylase family protein [Candidatus Bathyarchaeota archaeon]|nr:polysaccharide deacetylase family protein [Candidatus Bathyarchaeota archaeon]
MVRGLGSVAALIIIAVVVIGACSPVFVSSVKADTPASGPAWNFEDHTFDHAQLVLLNSSQILWELQTMDSVFQEHGLPPPLHFAYPEGLYNSQVISVVSQFRLSGRTAGGGSYFPEPYPVPEWYTLSCASLQADTSLNQIKAWINETIANKGLLNLYTHAVSDPPIAYGITPTRLEQILGYLQEQQNEGNLLTLTMRDAYTAYDGQKAVVVISFDDGWVTDYTQVWPLFKEYGFAGTSYINGASPDMGNPDVLTWSMIEEMAQVTPPSNWSVSIGSNPTLGGSTSPSGAVSVSGSLTVTATPASGYSFSYWLFDGANLTSNPVILPSQSAGSSHSLIAYFTEVSPPPNWWLLSVSVNGSVGGTTNPSGPQNVTSGTLTVTATPTANYSFSKWLFDGNTLTSNPVTLPNQTAETNHTLLAFFTPVPQPEGWLVSVSVNGSTGGTTAPSGLQNVTSGTLTVTAYPATNYSFDYWLFDGVNLTSNPIVLPAQTAGTNHTLVAFFKQNPAPYGWLVSINVDGSVGGTTTPLGVVNVTSGALTVTASPTANYAFSYWLFDGNNLTANPITLPTQAAGTSHTLVAYFKAVTQPTVVLFEDGFESGDFSAWSEFVSSGCSLSVVGLGGVEGACCAGVDVSGGFWPSGFCGVGLDGESVVYCRAYFKFGGALPSVGTYFFVMGFGGSSDLCFVNFARSGGGLFVELGYRNGAGWEYADCSYSFSLDTWYCLELYVKVDSLLGEYGVWLDGDQIIGLSNKNSAGAGYVTSVNVGLFSDCTNVAHQVFYDAVSIGNTYNGP